MAVTLHVKEFEREMLSRTRRWSEVAEELGATPGLRAVEFPAALLREAILSAEVTEWLKHLFGQLPADAAVMDWFGAGPVQMKPSAGAYTDVYFFVVASREWPAIEEGAEIPVFTPIFKHESAAA